MSASRRKKRGSLPQDVDDIARPAPSAEKRLPPARPPRKNLPLLLLFAGLFCVWVGLLIVLAVYY